jgi:hypothetical protein
MDLAVGTGVSLLGLHRNGQGRRHKTVEGPIDEGPPHGEDPAHFVVRLELASEGEPVARAFGEEPEDGMFCH